MSDSPAAPVPPARPRVGRGFRVLLGVLALTVIWSTWNYVEARRLERAMAALQERADSLEPPPPANGPKYADDAARLYDAAADVSVYHGGQLLFTKVLSRKVEPLSAEDAAAARDVLAENALTFDLVSRAASMPMRERDSEYRERARSGQPLNSLFGRLSFRTCALARDGQFDAAAAALAEHIAALRMFDRIAHDPTASLGTPTIKVSMLARAIDDLSLVLNLGRPSGPSLERLQSAFAIDVSRDFDQVLLWEIRLLSEVAPTVPLVTRYTATGMRIPAFTPPVIEMLLLPPIRREQARAADVIAETIDASAKPVPARLAHLQAIFDAHSNRGFSIVTPWSTLPAIVTLSRVGARRIASADAQARCAVVSLAVERFRLKTGRTPGSLSELMPAHLDAIPLDPFGSEPLRYVADTAGYSVYSVGENGKDDGATFQVARAGPGGATNPPPDIGIRVAIR